MVRKHGDLWDPKTGVRTSLGAIREGFLEEVTTERPGEK